MIEFIQKKKMQIEKLGREGADLEILPILNVINSKERYFSTSSCAGRIVLMSSSKKGETKFILKSHKRIGNFGEIFDKIKEGSVFRFEGMILHIACFDYESAVDILKIARGLGWKRSGLISDKKAFIVEISSSEKIEVPLNKKINREFFEFLCRKANSMLSFEREKMKVLETQLKQKL